jgi:RNA polymerase sigma-70 factor (ECF subfamily)
MIKNKDSWLHKIYMQYRDKVAGYFLKKLNSREEVEDMVSQVFLEVTRCAERFDRNKASESTWIYAICRNLGNRYLRDKYTHEKNIIEVPDIEEQYNHEAGEIERYILSDSLASSLSQLGQDKRRIIILSFYYGFSPQEIADRLKLSYTNVCVLKSRALKELGKMIDKQK